MRLSMKNKIGNKICIIGLSSSGKSTLADKISKIKSLKLLHIDQIAHVPNTNWEQRKTDEYREIHDNLIKEDKWVIDGCYVKLLPQRLAHADTVIFIKMNRFACVLRFLLRAFKKDDKRYGKLKGAKRDMSLGMVKYILFRAPYKFPEYEKMIKQNPHLNVIYLKSFKEIDELVASLKK